MKHLRPLSPTCAPLAALDPLISVLYNISTYFTTPNFIPACPFGQATEAIMKIVHLISGGDSGGAKTHIFSLLQELGRTERVLLICFRAGPFSMEAQALGIPTEVIAQKKRFSCPARAEEADFRGTV
jgi:hypothetical protein